MVAQAHCPFLVYIVPLPPAYNVDCLTHRSDRELVTARMLEPLVHLKLNASPCVTRDRELSTFRLVPFYHYVCKKKLGTKPDHPGNSGLPTLVRKLWELLQRLEPQLFSCPEKYFFTVGEPIFNAFVTRAARQLKYVGRWEVAPRLTFLTKERLSWNSSHEQRIHAQLPLIASIPYPNPSRVRQASSGGGGGGTGAAAAAAGRSSTFDLPPWLRGGEATGGAKRDTVVAAAMGTAGGFNLGGQYRLRSRLMWECQRAKPSLCRAFTIDLASSHGLQKAPTSVDALYRRSHFSLQPPGDSVTRKGIFDSLAFGCVPVVFSSLSTSQYGGAGSDTGSGGGGGGGMGGATAKGGAASLSSVAVLLDEREARRKPGVLSILRGLVRDGTVAALRARLYQSYWRWQYDGQPWAASPDARCDALCEALRAAVARTAAARARCTRPGERRS